MVLNQYLLSKSCHSGLHQLISIRDEAPQHARNVRNPWEKLVPNGAADGVMRRERTCDMWNSMELYGTLASASSA